MASGKTPVSAALELVKLPADQQIKVFEPAQGGEKITAAKVRQKRQETHHATGEGGPVPRTLKQFRAFLEGKTGPADPGHKLASQPPGIPGGQADRREAWTNTGIGRSPRPQGSG